MDVTLRSSVTGFPLGQTSGSQDLNVGDHQITAYAYLPDYTYLSSTPVDRTQQSHQQTQISILLPSTGPDLTASFSNSPPGTMAAGDQADVSFSVNNIGTGSADGSVAATFSLVPIDSTTNGGQTIPDVGSASATIASNVTTPSPIAVHLTIPPATPAGTYNLTGTLSDSGLGDTDTADKTIGPVVVSITPSRADILPNSIAWDKVRGGLTFTYRIKNKLTSPDAVQVYFASGAGVADELGAPLFTQTIAAGTPAGLHHGEVPAEKFVADAPSGVSALILSGDSGNPVKSVNDVTLVAGTTSLGDTVDISVLSDYTIAVVKDLLRQSGQAVGTVTSTLRTAEDQARIMFNNALSNKQSRYGAAGRAVLVTYQADIKGHAKDKKWIKAHADQIEADMVDTINAQPARAVSHHIQSLASYATYNVLDIAPSSFVSNFRLFEKGALADTSRILHFYDIHTKTKDFAFHLEIPQPGMPYTDMPSASDTA